MKEVIKYESDSGVVYSKKEDALKDDLYWERAKEILKYLPPTDGINFHNGEGWLECQRDKVEMAKVEFLALASKYFNQSFTNIDGIVGRYISDSSSRAFNELLYKLQSIDNEYRLWGQIYYRLNPSKGTNKKLN